jgi:cytochrome c553
VDALVRSRRLLLIVAPLVAFAACSPAKREPVGVSNGGAIEHGSEGEAGANNAPPLAGLPPDFRATWSRVGLHVASEHGRFVADVYRDHESWAEDLYFGDAGAGVYLLEHGDAGVRFAVADERGRTVADGDAGASLDACVRCHAGARDSVFDVHQ